MFIDPRNVVLQLGLINGMKVADFGSGVGHYVIPLADVVGLSGRVYAVDIQQELLGKVADAARKQHAPTVEVVWGDIDEEGGSHLTSESVDLVLFANVMFQLEKKESAAKEAGRVIRSKGQVAIVDWSESYGGMGPQPEVVFNEGMARALFKGAGFQFVRTFKTGAHHYGLLFRKV